MPPTVPQLELRHLADCSPAQRDRGREIYEGSFPLRQRGPFAQVLERGSGYRGQLVLRGGSVVGVCFASVLESIAWWFLEYVAIDPALRGGGLGGEVWRHVREAAAAAGVQGVVLEVEDPDEPGIDAAEREVRVRRLRFWERCGPARLPVPNYVVPNVGTVGTEPLVLMAYPAPTAMSGGMLARVVRAVLVEGYALAADDPLVTAALRGLD